MKVIITFTFCCGNLCKCKYVALEKPGELGEFFSYFVANLSCRVHVAFLTIAESTCQEYLTSGLCYSDSVLHIGSLMKARRTMFHVVLLVTKRLIARYSWE